MNQPAIFNAQWFDLGHYEAVEGWGELEWFRAISCRQGVNMWIEGKLPGVENAMDIVGGHFTNLWADPISPAGMDSIQVYRTALLDQKRINYVRPVQGIEPSELAGGWTEHWKCTRAEYRLAMVDIKAADTDILDAFTAWLKDVREGQRIGRVTSTDMRQWTELRVLPFIDLRLFTAASGVHITQVQMANALFPDDLHVDHVERLRKSTKKHADRLMRQDFLSQLAGQVGMQGP